MRKNKVGTAKRELIILLTISLMFVLIIPSFSQIVAYKSEILNSKALTGWSEDIKLSEDEADCAEYPDIATANNYIHIIWTDWRDGNPELYYKWSINNGATWSPDTRLTFADGWSYYPRFVAVNDTIHMVWIDDRGALDEIYYKKSTNNGDTWTDDTPLTSNDGYSSEHPAVRVGGSIVHVVWTDWRDGNAEIYYKNSTDGGDTWNENTRLTFWSNSDTGPEMAVNGNNVHVVWGRYLPSKARVEVFYIKSLDGGITWQLEQQLTVEDGYNSFGPRIAVNGNIIYVVFGDEKDGEREVYFMKSTDNGDTWSTPVRLSDLGNKSDGGGLAVEGNNLYVEWYDMKDGNAEIYYTFSTNNGDSWNSPIRLTYNDANSYSSVISVCGGYIHLVFVDNRTGNTNYDTHIYYKRSPDFASNISLTANPGILPADGASTSIITATVTNKTGSPIQGLNVSFSIESGGGTLLSNYDYTDSNGNATVTYQAGTISGNVVINATVDGVWNTTIITLTSEGPADISLTALPSVLTADGTSTSLITATVTNETGSPVEGVNVNFIIESGDGSLLVDSDVTDANGDATTIYTSGTTTGDVVIKATADSISNTTTITLHPEPVDWIYIEPPGPIGLNITETQIFTATGYDMFGNINNSWTPYWSTDHGLGAITPDGFTCTYTAGNTAGIDYINVTDTFTGVYNVSQINIISKDDKPPVVIDKTPTGTNVSVNTNITATFNETMNQTSVINAFIIFPDVDGDFSWDNNTLIFTPTNPLSYNTTYNVTMTTDATDLVGNHLENNYSWEFTTEKEPDTTPPTIIEYTPAGDNIPVDTIITVTFNESMNQTSVEEAFTITPVVTGDIGWNGNTMIFTPTNPLSYNETYNVTITTDATDVAGNHLESNYFWGFTTEKEKVNHKPVIKYYQPLFNPLINETELLTFNITATDPDNDNLTYYWYINSILLTWEISDSYIFISNYTSYGVYEIKVIVTDDGSPQLTDNHTWTLTVLNKNRLPVLETVWNQTAYEGQLFTLQVNASDPDNDTITFSDNTTLFEINSTTGFISFTPDYDSAGTYMINITVSDEEELVWRAFKLTVLNVNRKPILDRIDNQTAYEGQLFTLQINAIDLDGDTLTFSDNSTFFDINLTTGLISFVPSYDSAGVYYINITVSDGEYLAWRVFKLTIINVNRKPSIGFIENQTAYEGQPFMLQVNASDPDNNNLIFSDNSTLFNINSTTGLISFTPNYESSGTYFINISVTDGENITYESFTLTIVNMSKTITEYYTVNGYNITVRYQGLGELFVEPASSIPPPPNNMSDIGIFINVTGTVSGDVFITIKYNDSDISGINESKLKMYYWTGMEWKLCNDTGVWPNNNTVWVKVDHLTVFAPMAEKAAGGAGGGINYWLLYTGVGSIAVIILIAVSLLMKRKRRMSKPAKPSEISPGTNLPKPNNINLMVRCPKCGGAFQISSTEISLGVICPKCGVKGKLK